MSHRTDLPSSQTYRDAERGGTMNGDPTAHRPRLGPPGPGAAGPGAAGPGTAGPGTAGPPGPAPRLAAADEPPRSFVDLGALPKAVPDARQHVRQMLAKWERAELAGTAEAVVSEIVTNAVQAASRPESGPGRAGQAPAVCLWLEGTGRGVRIEVWDNGTGRPQRREPDPDAESGRGLLLVEALSEGWGCLVPTGWHGKIVWAQIGPSR